MAGESVMSGDMRTWVREGIADVATSRANVERVLADNPEMSAYHRAELEDLRDKLTAQESNLKAALKRLAELYGDISEYRVVSAYLPAAPARDWPEEMLPFPSKQGSGQETGRHLIRQGSKTTLCGLDIARALEVFTPVEAACAECLRRAGIR